MNIVLTCSLGNIGKPLLSGYYCNRQALGKVKLIDFAKDLNWFTINN